MSGLIEISTKAIQKINHSRREERVDKKATKSKKTGGSAAKKVMSLTRVQIFEQKSLCKNQESFDISPLTHKRVQPRKDSTSVIIC